MRQSRILVLTVTLLFFSLVFDQSSEARGLLGENYLRFSIGQTTPGDDEVKEIDDSIFHFGMSFRTPTSPNFDSIIGASVQRISGNVEGVRLEANQSSFYFGGDYHFSPDQETDPFIGGRLAFVTTEAEASIPGDSYSEEDDDIGISIGAGVEVDINDQAAFIPTIVYSKIDDYDDVSAGIGLVLWLSEKVLSTVSMSYAFDDGDVSISAGMGFNF